MLSLFSLVCTVSIFLSFVFSGARILYKVKYHGKNIAIVAKKESFDTAKKQVIKLVQGKNVEKAVAAPEYTATLAPAFAVNKQEEIVNAIIENTDEIVLGSYLIIDGENTLCAESVMLGECLNYQLNRFNLKDELCSSSFVEDVQVKKGYFLKDDICGQPEIETTLERLTVRTEVRFVTNVTVPYSTVEIKSDNLMIGLRQKTMEGKNGITQIIKRSIYINGVLEQENVESENVISEPVDEVVSVGTVVPDFSQYGVEYVGSGMAFPISSSRWSVSAYFGDGRGHKGIDLSTYEGAPILAVSAGTVTLSEWYYGYGNCVIVDHGNGFTTLYGHCSSLLASVGQHVEAGDVIALVGSTGDSTGSHLHFEISINGDRIDPAPYLGLYGND